MTQALRYNDGKARLSLLPATCHRRAAFILATNHPELSILEGALRYLIGVLYEDQTTAGLRTESDKFVCEYKHDISRVLAMGAKKYAPWNWTKGMSFMSVFDSLMRHVDRINTFGEELDQESGLPHIGHIGANLLFLTYYLENLEYYTEFDDRVDLSRGVCND